MPATSVLVFAVFSVTIIMLASHVRADAGLYVVARKPQISPAGLP
jgi:hypothetical protein